MDIEKLRKYTNQKIDAGNSVAHARKIIMDEKYEKQDRYEGISEAYKPLLDKQDMVKKTIDEKQDQLIEQLQNNQRGIEDMILYAGAQEGQPYTKTTLPIDYQPSMTASEKEIKSDLDKGFNFDEIEILTDYGLPPPSRILKMSKSDADVFTQYSVKTGKLIKELGSKKGSLMKTKRQRDKNKEEIFDLNKQIKTLQNYKKRVEILPEGTKTITGRGVYNQPRRNAYKISPTGQYGNLKIDLPKLAGQLRLVAYKDGQKVYNKIVDFDTLDLLTKRFNSKKNYSALSKKVFDELNQLSEIPIHKTSKKFSKIGKGVVYYNNTNDLLDRLELLGGEISAGNSCKELKNDFSSIAHKLRDLGEITTDQLDQLIENYIM